MSYDSISGKTVIAGKHASSTTPFRAKKTPSELNDEAINALHSSWEQSSHSENSKPRRFFEIPKESLISSKGICESIGFSFISSKDSSCYLAIMPPGWRVISLKSANKLYVVDSKNHRRAERIDYFNKSSFYLLKRYVITFWHPEPSTVEVGIKDSDSKVIYSAGRCAEVDSDEYNKFVKKCRVYLQENFPDWKEYDAYWD